MTDTIEKILLEKGPLLSGELAQLIKEETHQSNDAIRKQLSRSKEPIKKIGGFLAHNQTFFYLDSHIAEGSFIDELLIALQNSAQRLFVIIKALEYHKGFLPETEVPSYGFSPIENLKGHKRADIILKDLFKLNLVQSDNNLCRLNPDYFRKTRIDVKNYKAIETAKNFIINQFMEWAKMIGLASFDTGKLNGEFGKFQWAFTSPSYIGTTVSYRDGNAIPSFIVADILIGNEIKEQNILFFIKKIETIKALRKLPKFIPFLIVDGLSIEALTLLKQNGVVVGFINRLFGNGYSELLQSLINTITNAGAILKKNPNEFFSLMEKINKLVDGKTNNLRGDVFELAVGYYHSRYCKSLDIGKQIYFGGSQKELDVFAVYADEIKVAECKGYKRALNLNEVDEWLIKIAFIRKWIGYQEPYNNKRHVFEIWSIGGFVPDALSKLKSAAKTTKYDIHFFGENEIIQKAKEIPNSKFLSILNQYFIKEIN